MCFSSGGPKPPSYKPADAWKHVKQTIKPDTQAGTQTAPTDTAPLVPPPRPTPGLTTRGM